jgi:hypothetical protein
MYPTFPIDSSVAFLVIGHLVSKYFAKYFDLLRRIAANMFTLGYK